MLRTIGYWTDSEGHGGKYIHPRDLVDPSWEASRRSRIVMYLRSGVKVYSEVGFSYCRFEGGPPDIEMGCWELSDGAYIWPQGLAIYVERYHVRLPNTFIRHMAKRNFSITTHLDMGAIERVRNGGAVSNFFWKAWCAKEKTQLSVKSVLARSWAKLKGRK